MGGNIVTKDEEKKKVLNGFFASVFNNQTPCSPSTQQLEMEYREGKQNETPIIQRQMISDTATSHRQVC